jgi:hypothetical protein
MMRRGIFFFKFYRSLFATLRTFFGKRSAENAKLFMQDLSERLDNRVQLSSDALTAYIETVEFKCGLRADSKSL